MFSIYTYLKKKKRKENRKENRKLVRMGWGLAGISRHPSLEAGAVFPHSSGSCRIANGFRQEALSDKTAASSRFAGLSDSPGTGSL